MPPTPQVKTPPRVATKAPRGGVVGDDSHLPQVFTPPHVPPSPAQTAPDYAMYQHNTPGHNHPHALSTHAFDFSAEEKARDLDRGLHSDRQLD